MSDTAAETALRIVLDDVADPEPPPPSWIAAYAMGLVASEHDGEGDVDELVRHVGHDRQLLASARRYLDRDVPVWDAELRRGALRLLDAAVDHAETAATGV